MKYIHPLIESKETCLSRMPNVAKRFEEVHGLNGDQFYELIINLVLENGESGKDKAYWQYSDMVDECSPSRQEDEWQSFRNEAWIPKTEMGFSCGPLPYRDCDLWKIEKAYWADTEQAHKDYLSYAKQQMSDSLPRTDAPKPTTKRSKVALVVYNNEHWQNYGLPMDGTHYAVGDQWVIRNSGKWQHVYTRQDGLELPSHYLISSDKLRDLIPYMEELSILIDWTKFDQLTECQKKRLSEEIFEFKREYESR